MKAVSSWSLHRTLGTYRSGDAPGRADPPAPPGAGLSLLALPAELASRGYDTVQLCHFHLPKRDASYLAELRSALEESAITLDAVLIDDGDLIGPTATEVDLPWISRWIDDAEALGAARVRVIAGQQTPDPERLRTSGERLSDLADRHPAVRVVTENWLALTPGPDEVNAVLDAAGDGVGLLIDLGNWTGPEKYAQLAAIAPRAETCHAKCHFAADGPDRDDFAESLRTLRTAAYTGPLALVYDGTEPEEWANLEVQHAIAGEIFD
ncbi:sugar phosphate isomerase/epimerase family protein [Microlunatus speluncae]|uniref:sugar phosphate isomerase/epimerase family protein n=1 Tax=Microlunatus speluncae TaxID=2594267 RepID=UPI00126633EF|nr:sugar phosphate isomerase/epimerase [Microlunatus speluncae]